MFQRTVKTKSEKYEKLKKIRTAGNCKKLQKCTNSFLFKELYENARRRIQSYKETKNRKLQKATEIYRKL